MCDQNLHLNCISGKAKNPQHVKAFTVKVLGHGRCEVAGICSVWRSCGFYLGLGCYLAAN
jgi:hypothetical protein